MTTEEIIGAVLACTHQAYYFFVRSTKGKKMDDQYTAELELQTEELREKIYRLELKIIERDEEIEKLKHMIETMRVHLERPPK